MRRLYSDLFHPVLNRNKAHVRIFNWPLASFGQVLQSSFKTGGHISDSTLGGHKTLKFLTNFLKF